MAPKDIKETQEYKNVQKLMESQCDSIADFARRIERSPSQAHTYVGPNPKKRIGGIIRKRIERAFGLPSHWLTQEDAEDLRDTPPRESLDLATVMLKTQELLSAIEVLTSNVQELNMRSQDRKR